MQNLLSFLHNRSPSKREDLASKVLALLLREEPGQAVLRQRLALPHNAIIDVTTQRQIEGCVPDICLWHDEIPVGVLEMKFWASITAHQFSGQYFKAAPKVIFVVPAERIESVENELSHLKSSNCLTVLSWKVVLAEIESKIDPASHSSRLFRGALDHLKEYCDVTEQEHFVPFTTEELRAPVQDTETQHFVWLARETISEAMKLGLLVEAGRPGAGFDTSFFYGQDVMLGGLKVWVGYWPEAWKCWPADGPMWVQVHRKEAALLKKTGKFENAVRHGKSELLFPLFNRCTPSGTQDDEVQLILSELRVLRDRISIHRPQEPTNS